MNSPLNILQVSLRADYGGGPEHLFRLLTGFSSNIQCFVACPREKPYWEKYRVIVGEQNMAELPHRSFSLAALVRLAVFARRSGITLIHSHGKGAGIYARPLGALLGIPVVHTFHGLHIGQYGRAAAAAYVLLEQVLTLLTRKVIAVADGEYMRLVSARIAPREKLVIIENGVEVPGNAAPSATGKRFRVLHISRFDFAKNPLAFAGIIGECAKRGSHVPLSFDIVGDGPELKAFKAEVAKTAPDADIVYHGFCDAMEPFFNAAGCLVSSSRWEGLPLGVIEAMAYGVPPVLSEVPGHINLITQHETGFLYPPSDPAAAAGYIIRLASEPRLRQSIAANARRAAIARFSAQRMVRETENLYFTVLKPNH